MSALELLDPIADRWLHLLIERSLAATAAFLVLGLLWLGLRRFCSSHVGSTLFLGALVPLIVPIESFLPWPELLPAPLSSWDTPRSTGGSTASTGDPSEPHAAADRLRPAEARVELAGEAPATTPIRRSPVRREETRSGSSGPEAIPGLEPVFTEEATAADLPVASRPSPDPAATELRGTASSTSSASPARHAVILAFVVWSLVVSALLLLFLRNQARTRAMVRRARPLREHALCEEFPTWLRAAGCRRPVRLAVSDELPSPAVWGFRRPVVLLPRELIDELPPSRLRWVVLHELAHLRRGDLWVSMLQQLLQIAYFFHPAVWCANACISRHRECACDDAAFARCRGLSASDCARTFLRVVETARRSPDRAAGVLSLIDRPSFLRRRLMRLADPHRRVSRGLSGRSYAFLAAATLGGWTASGASLNGAAEPPPTPSAPSPGQPALAAPSRTAPVEPAAPVAPSVDEEVREAIERGVDWLVRNQHDDGSWSPDGLGPASTPAARAATPPTAVEKKALIVPDPFDPGVETVTATAPPPRATPPSNKPQQDLCARIGCTGLALLALLESERSLSDDAVRRAWQRGRKFLLSHQDAQDGCLAPRTHHAFVYSHLMAAQALMKCLRREDHPASREAAQKALDFLARMRNPYRAWRYDYPPVGDNDSSVSSIALLTLMAGDRLDLKIDESAVRDGLAYLDEMTDPATGRTGYHERGSLAARNPKDRERYPAELSEAVTAVALNVRLGLAQRADSPSVKAGAQLLAERPPVWSEDGRSVDYYYWFFGMSALRALGGEERDLWRACLQAALLPVQETRDTPAQGAWPRVGVWSEQGGTVYATSLSMLALRHSMK